MTSDELTQIDTPYGVFWTRHHDFVNQQLREYGGHQRSEIGLVKSLLGKGGAVIDVGAHIGTFSIPLAQHVGASGHVYSFEPTAESHQILNRNIESNGLSGCVTPVNALVSDQVEDYRSQYQDDHTSAAFYLPVGDEDEASEAQTEDLTCIELDRWAVDEADLDRLDMIKVDTEGMELRVLRSAASLIEKFKPAIMVEISVDHLARAGDTVEEVDRFLRDFGYHLFRNLGPRHSRNEDFRLARIWSAQQVIGFFDLIAVHPESEYYPAKALSPIRNFAGWILKVSSQLPVRVKRKLIG